MADTSPKYIKMTTPQLRFRYPKLDKPDYGTKDYPCPAGRYSVDGIGQADDPAVQKFIANLQPHFDVAVRNAEDMFKALKAENRKKLGSVNVNAFYTEMLDPETEQPTGEVLFKFKMAASYTFTKGPKTGQTKTVKPLLFDAKDQLINNVPEIWGGTIGRVSFDFPEGGYFIPGTAMAGLSFKLLAVQIIDLVSGGQRTARDHGFGEEDGYAHADTPAQAAGFTADNASGDDADF